MESINGPVMVKEHNLRLVREQLFRARSATRQELSAVTGISNVTMGSLMRKLLESGEVLESEEMQVTTGRPAHVYSYNAQSSYRLLISVGIHEGVSLLSSVLVNLYGETVWEETRPVQPMDKGTTLSYLNRLLHLRNPVSAISVGLPGVGFDSYLRGSGALSLEALEELAQEPHLSIQVENDVNLMAVGYAARHHLGTEETLAYLYLMKGSYGGSAVLVDGKLHHGKNRFAGELLWPPYGPDWHQVTGESKEAQQDALLLTTLPYMSILAPHRVVIASDYLTESQLEVLETEARTAFRDEYAPKLELDRFPQKDYHDGMKQVVLELLAEQILKR